jgi:putative DNA primase/helicase
VRDPLLALGCRDPAERISEAKERDGRRQTITELFAIWWERHGDWPVAARELHEDVRHAADPQGRGRQYLAAFLERLAGTRMAGFVLTRQPPAGHWGAGNLCTRADGRGGGA